MSERNLNRAADLILVREIPEFRSRKVRDFFFFFCDRVDILYSEQRPNLRLRL